MRRSSRSLNSVVATIGNLLCRSFLRSGGGVVRKNVVVFALWLVVASSSALFAQATSTINGRAVDQAGAVLPGATVTAANTGTGVARNTVTNAEGLYSIPALDRGNYDLSVEL